MVRLKNFMIFVLFVYISFSRLCSISSVKVFVKQLNAAIIANDFDKQREILSSYVSDVSNFKFKKGLDKVFKSDRNSLFKILVLLDDSKILKKYFNVRKISNIRKKRLLLLLENSLLAGNLRISKDIINKAKVYPTSEMLVVNFNSIAIETDLNKIKKFVEAIKRIDLLSTLLHSRDVFKEKDLKAFIHYVAKYCNINWLKILINEGVNVELEDKWKNTPFHLVVMTSFPGTLERKVEFINFMIKKRNVDILYKNRDNKTALDLANEYLSKVKKLLRNTKSLLIKKSIERKVVVYSNIVKILGKLQRD